MRLPKTFKSVNQSVDRACKRHGVRVYKYANVGNHLHLLIKIPGRKRWAAFIRELSGRVAQAAQSISGQEKGGSGFWMYRPFTRIVRGWKRAFKAAKDYIELNILEAEGFIRRDQIKNLRELRVLLELDGS